MIMIVITMLLVLAVAALVVLYAAYPARGQRPPYVPWLGEAMEKAADAMPTLDPEEQADFSLRR